MNARLTRSLGATCPGPPNTRRGTIANPIAAAALRPKNLRREIGRAMGLRDTTRCFIAAPDRSSRNSSALGCCLAPADLSQKESAWLLQNEAPLGTHAFSGLTSSLRATMAALRRGRRFADDQLRRYGKVFRVVLETLDPLQQDARSGFPHIAQRLPHGGQARVVVRGHVNVVETHDRNILRNLQVRIAQSPDGADCRDVVERNQRCEFFPVLQ